MDITPRNRKGSSPELIKLKLDLDGNLEISLSNVCVQDAKELLDFIATKIGAINDAEPNKLAPKQGIDTLPSAGGRPQLDRDGVKSKILSLMETRESVTIKGIVSKIGHSRNIIQLLMKELEEEGKIFSDKRNDWGARIWKLSSKHQQALKCRFCKSINVVKYGTRKVRGEEIQRYKCKDCKRKFISDRYPRRKYNKLIIDFVMEHKEHSAIKISKMIEEEFGEKIHRNTIFKWLNEWKEEQKEEQEVVIDEEKIIDLLKTKNMTIHDLVKEIYGEPKKYWDDEYQTIYRMVSIDLADRIGVVGRNEKLNVYGLIEKKSIEEAPPIAQSNLRMKEAKNLILNGMDIKDAVEKVWNKPAHTLGGVIKRLEIYLEKENPDIKNVNLNKLYLIINRCIKSEDVTRIISRNDLKRVCDNVDDLWEKLGDSKSALRAGINRIFKRDIRFFENKEGDESYFVLGII